MSAHYVIEVIVSCEWIAVDDASTLRDAMDKASLYTNSRIVEYANGLASIVIP